MDDVTVEFACNIAVTVTKGEAQHVTFELLDDVEVYGADDAGLYTTGHEAAIEAARAPIVDLVEYINHYETEEPPL